MPMTETTIIRWTPACWPTWCRFLAGDHVHTEGSGDRDDLVSAGPERLDDVAADPSGRSRDRDLRRCLHDYPPRSGVVRRSNDAPRGTNVTVRCNQPDSGGPHRQ